MRNFLIGTGVTVGALLLFAIALFLSPWIVMFAWNVWLIPLIPMLPQISYWATFWILWAVGIVGRAITGANKALPFKTKDS